jgi:pyridoxamine 5'-phosphate oxidase
VLLKGLRPEGLVFFTNYESRKGQDLAFNPKCSLSFYWDSLFRQVHFYGSVEKTTRKESEDYWRSRPRLSQLSQWISRQSEVAQSKVEIEKALKDAEAQFQNREIPCPAHWGGYLFKPTFVEFWIGREARLHDRYTYQLVEDQWRGARLYP